MKVALIVAMDKENGIGKNNDLMWHLPDDMKFFKETTLGHIVVMGRKNYDSIPEKYRPLFNRENVVLTRSSDYNAAGCSVFNSIDECIEKYKDEKDRTVFIIGGGEIYKLAMSCMDIDEMYITHVDKVYNAETFFPEFDRSQWNTEIVMKHPADERHEASFTIVHYTKK